MAQRFAKPWVRTSVKISPEFYELCQKHRIKFSEAIRVGISILLAERGEREYDNSLNIVRRVSELKIKAAEYALKAANLENGHGRIKSTPGKVKTNTK